MNHQSRSARLMVRVGGDEKEEIAIKAQARVANFLAANSASEGKDAQDYQDQAELKRERALVTEAADLARKARISGEAANLYFEMWKTFAEALADRQEAQWQRGVPRDKQLPTGSTDWIYEILRAANISPNIHNYLSGARDRYTLSIFASIPAETKARYPKYLGI